MVWALQIPTAVRSDQTRATHSFINLKKRMCMHISVFLHDHSFTCEYTVHVSFNTSGTWRLIIGIRPLLICVHLCVQMVVCECMNSCQPTTTNSYQPTDPFQLHSQHGYSSVSPYTLTCILTHTHTCIHANIHTYTYISPFSSHSYQSSYHVNSCDMVRLGG